MDWSAAIATGGARPPNVKEDAEMTHRLRAECLCAAGMAVVAWLTVIAAAQAPAKPDSDVKAGRKLFLRDWKNEGKLNDTGDGLGPVFNDVSCVACHSQKGIGGGGPESKNVDLLSLSRRSFPRRVIQQRRYIRLAQATVHPAYSPSTLSLTLHKQGPPEAFRNQPKLDYATYRARLLGERTIFRNNLLTRKRPTRRIGRVVVQFSQRNTPALYGAGLIDSIPGSVLQDIARKQAKDRRKTGISGRFAGRFGWRGQTATLHDFVLGACANELGLEVPGHAQPESPDDILNRPASARLAPRKPNPKTLDLTEQQCRSLTAFVASLPAPQRSHADSPAALQGEKLFAKIGCAGCHVPHVGAVQAIYSDLLLHDMGKGLIDPVSAPGKSEISRSPSFGGYSGGGGSDNPLPIARTDSPFEREWRTPPLWGVADSAPYLHDGRAATLDEAIRWHSGEGALSMQRYRRLSRAERNQVISFLKTFVAPPPGAPPVAVAPRCKPSPPDRSSASVGLCANCLLLGR